MKRIICIFLVLSVLFSVVANADLIEDEILDITPEDMLTWTFEDVSSELNVQGKGAILVEPSSGTVLFEQKADERLPIASVTKVMTILLIVEALDSGNIGLDDIVTVSETAASMGGSQAFMEPGETMTVNDMLKAICVSSCNDGAVAMAEHLAGTEGAFVIMMNKRAEELGMTNTEFVNCTGLDDAETGFSTARDVMLMSSELMKHPRVYDYTTIWMDTIRNGQFGLTNTNKLIRFYSGARGLKTGSTSKALYCLSACARKNDMDLLCVVLGEPTSAIRFADAKSLLSYGFANYGIFTPRSEVSTIKVNGGKKDTVELSCNMSPIVTSKSDISKIEEIIELQESVNAPVDKNQKVGTITFKIGDEILETRDIKVTEEVEKMNVFDIFKMLFARFFSK